MHICLLVLRAILPIIPLKILLRLFFCTHCWLLDEISQKIRVKSVIFLFTFHFYMLIVFLMVCPLPSPPIAKSSLHPSLLILALLLPELPLLNAELILIPPSFIHVLYQICRGVNIIISY
jgi:hypothetical protein